MKFQLTNIFKEDRVFMLLPVVAFSFHKTDRGVALGWLSWGIMISPNPVKKTFVECKVPINGFLTRGKEYEVIKILPNAFVVKRDDDSIHKVSKERFGEPFER